MMAVLGEFSREFLPSVLLVADEHSTDEVPDWSSPHEMVTASPTAMVLRVQHGVDGPVHVRVLTEAEEAPGVCVFTGSIRIDSGTLILADAALTDPYRIALDIGIRNVSVYADDWENAASVDVVLQL